MGEKTGRSFGVLGPLLRRAMLPVRTLSIAGGLGLFLAAGGPLPLVASDSRAALEGFTEPYQQIDLAAHEPGVLTEIRVREGTRVRQGELVGQLDTVILERTLAIARQRATSLGASKAAEAERELRQKHLVQLQQLHRRGHATQQELDRAEADLAIAEARSLMTKEELELQRLECQRIEAQIERRQLRSPIDGVVSDVAREAGEAFLANDPRVLTIVQTNRLRAKFAAPLTVAQKLQPGQAVRLQFPENQGACAGKVESISPVMDAKSGTISVTVVIENGDERIASGARCLLAVDSNHDPETEKSQTQYTNKKRP